ncbi:MAG: hypothetical protein HY954_06755 [Deltaproteobacteria bacterium]|nr:hypothetical protein [Deltaproteobacteria bacterium]
MPTVHLDDIKVEFEDKEKSATVGELVDALEKELMSIKRFIMEISIDGEDVPEWRGSAAMSKKISVHGEIRLKTASIEDMASVGLETVKEYINVIKDNMDACVRDLRVGSEKTADTAFLSIFEGVVEVVKTMDALSHGTARYKMDLFKKNPLEYYVALHQKLETIKNIKLSGDTVLLADVLEYELKPLLEEIEENIFN